MTDSNLKKAFEIAYDREMSQLEKEMNLDSNMKVPFSSEFEYRIQIMMQKRGKGSSSTQKKIGRLNYRRMLFVAAIVVIVLAMAATVIGIVRPQIFYDIKEKLTHWDIQFMQKSEEAITPGFEYIRPEIPKGYRITEEVKTFEDYDITMEDDAGHVIYYLQMEANSTSLDLFNETEEIRQTEIGGRNAVISHNEDMHTILIEDGKYVYLLEGECDYDTLMELAKKIIQSFE